MSARAASLLLLLTSLLLGGCPSVVQVRPAWLDLADGDALRALAATDPRAERDLGLRELLVEDAPDRAEETLRHAAERDPGDPLTLLALASLADMHGRRSEAVRLHGRAAAAAAAEGLAPDFCAPAALTPPPSPERCRTTALAIEEVAARAIMATEVTGQPEAARALLDAAGRRLSFPAAHLVHRALEREARRRGEAERAGEELEAAGCVLGFRSAGPFGPHPLQSFDLEHAPERDGSLAERYDLGPGRGEQPTRQPDLSGCEVQLAEPLGRAGTWYGEAAIRASAPGLVDVRLWAPPTAAVAVWIGGVEVLRRDGRSAYEPSVSVARVEVSAEPTRVLIKLTSEARDPAFSLSLAEVSTGRRPEVLDATSGPWPGRGRAVQVGDLLEAFAPQPGEAIAPPRAVMTSFIADARRHGALAEEAMSRVEAGSATLLYLRGDAAGSSPTAPSGVRADRRLSDLQDALERDPQIVGARLAVAARLAGENQLRDAMTLLEEGVALQPSSVDLWLALGSLARRLDLQARARQALERAFELDDRECSALAELAALAAGLHLDRERDAQLERLVACDATSRGLADALARADRLDEALSELRRVQGVTDYPAALDSDIADLEQRAGDRDAALQSYERLAARWPRTDTFQAALADLRGEAEGAEAAREVLERAAALYPWEMSGLRRPAGALGARREIEAYRVDGADHILRYVRSRATYDAPSVYVLDRAVYRVASDLSTIRLVHQIAHVLTQEAVGPLSEFRAPEGAEVLTLRTIKADGRVLEPVELDLEGTTNLAGVEVGDFVEWEYIDWGGPSVVYPGGLVTPRFYFATPDTAMHLTELIVLVPEGIPVEYVPRGPAPPTGEAVRLGGLPGMRFAAERVPSQIREPDMPSPNEVFPSVAAAIGESPEAAVQAWYEGLMTAMREDFRMRDLVRDLRRPGQTEVELARALYGYVLEHVQPGSGGASASYTLAAGRGDPLVLLAALLRTAGLEAEIAYVYTLASDRSGPYPVPAEMTGALVRTVLDDEEWYLSVGSRHAAFGHLPSSYRGQAGMICGPSPRAVTLPAESRVPDLVEVHVEGELGADGGVSLTLHESYLGARAEEMRRDVSRIPAAERAPRGAAMLGAQYPGAIAEDVRFEGVDDRDVPLEVLAGLTSRMLGRREGRSVLLPARLANLVRYSRLAQLSERRTPLVFDVELREVVEQRLRLPPGARVEAPCVGATVESELGRFTVTCSVEGGSVLVHRLELEIEPERVSPEAYPDFAALLQGYDEAAATESRIALP